MKPTPLSSAQGTPLCLSCGFCCDGTLFTATKVDPAAMAAAAGWPGDVRDSVNQKQKLAQPCPAFQNRLCAIYTDHPKVCRKFECTLLTEFQSGATSHADALALIQATRENKRAFMESVSEFVPMQPAMSVRDVFRQFHERFKQVFDTPGFRRQHAKSLLLYARLNHILQTRFQMLSEEENHPE